MSIPDRIRRQPVVTVGIVVSAIVAAIKATNGFGLTTITPEQQDALTGMVVAMWPILAIIWASVTPAAAPRLPAGKTVELPDGTRGTVMKG